MCIQSGDNSLIDVVSLEKRMRSSMNPDFRYRGVFTGSSLASGSLAGGEITPLPRLTFSHHLGRVGRKDTRAHHGEGRDRDLGASRATEQRAGDWARGFIVGGVRRRAGGRRGGLRSGRATFPTSATSSDEGSRPSRAGRGGRGAGGGVRRARGVRSIAIRRVETGRRAGRGPRRVRRDGAADQAPAARRGHLLAGRVRRHGRAGADVAAAAEGFLAGHKG